MVASGEGAPGCELDRSPPEVCALFDSADLIISKGQGNYEALSDEPYAIYFAASDILMGTPHILGYR